jgi:hypothetical protein
MKNFNVFFRIKNDIIILKLDESLDDIEKTINVTKLVEKWAIDRNTTIDNLTDDDIELLKIELFCFGGIEHKQRI